MKIVPGPRLNMSLYGLLLVITPFLLLQNYLQDAIGMLSRISFSMGQTEIPVFLLFALHALAASLILLFRNFTRWRAAGILIVVFLFWISYNTSDYYFNHHFYDIQHNWHYFAYAIYAWLAWRYYLSMKLSIEKFILRTFLMALGISLMDEIIQVFISSRVFDLSDVAKDLMGCMIGQAFIHLVLFDKKHLQFNNFWPSDLKAWTKNSAWLLSLELLFAWVFLNVSSILSDSKYTTQVLFITLGIFFFLAVLFQLLGRKPGRYVAAILLALLVLYPTASILLKKPRVSNPTESLIIYKGVPILYFDLMIYPNGLMRPVDKKTSFNSRDRQKITDLGADILILATGTKGEGGKGFQDQLDVEMRYNTYHKMNFQIIKLPNKKACRLYNRLVREGKKVLMIIHNS